jgi:DNA-binding Lrp family transcriptional regulator
MHEFIHGELSRIGGVIRLDTYFIKTFKKRYEGLFDESKAFEPVKLNGMEWKLITELTKNGRMNMNEISEKVGMHVSTVSRRIHSLINRGLIRVIAVPNPERFGYYSNAFILLDIEAVRMDHICEILFPHPEIVHITTLINGSGLIIGIQTRNNGTLYKFIKEKIAQTSGIRRIETFITAELKKRYYGWFIDEAEM